jgi:outer membrane protein assembly factor BamB
MPPAAILAALTALLMTLPAAMPVSGAGGGAPAKAGVLVFLDDSDYQWRDIELAPGMSALCATVSACRELGLSFNYSMSQYGAYVTGIGGLNAPADFSWWWYLLLWNGTKGAWQEAPVGASDLNLSAGDNICWCPNNTAPPVPNPVTKYPWPSFRGNLKNNGIAAGRANVEDNLKWTADLANGPIDTTPAVASGRVFVSTGGIYNWTTMSYDQPPHLYALDAATGKQLWSAQTSAAGWQVSSPAVRNGRVIIGTSDGKVLAFSEDTGTPLWTFSTGASPTGVTASPVVTADAVYVATGDGMLYALSPEGKQMWNFSLGGPAYMSTPALSDGRLFAGTDNGTFWCVALNGTPVWNLSVAGKIRCSPVVSGDELFVIGTVYDGWTAVRSALHMLQLVNGTPNGKTIDLPATTSSPAVFTYVNTFFYIGDDSGIRAYDTTGYQNWANRTEGPVQSSPVLNRRAQVFYLDNSRNGSLHVGHTGWADWFPPWNFTPEPRQYILGSPAVADGFLYFGSDNGKVYCMGGSPAKTTGPAKEKGPFKPSPEMLAATFITVVVIAIVVAATRWNRGRRQDG